MSDGCDSETSRKAERIEDLGSLHVTTGEDAILSLIQIAAGLLSLLDVDSVTDAVFFNKERSGWFFS